MNIRVSNFLLSLVYQYQKIKLLHQQKMQLMLVAILEALNGLLRLKFMLAEEARLEELNLLIPLKRL